MRKLASKSISPAAGFGGRVRITSALSVLLLGPVLSGCFILGSERPELGLEIPAALLAQADEVIE